MSMSAPAITSKTLIPLTHTQRCAEVIPCEFPDFINLCRSCLLSLGSEDRKEWGRFQSNAVDNHTTVSLYSYTRMKQKKQWSKEVFFFNSEKNMNISISKHILNINRASFFQNFIGPDEFKQNSLVFTTNWIEKSMKAKKKKKNHI